MKKSKGYSVYSYTLKAPFLSGDSTPLWEQYLRQDEKPVLLEIKFLSQEGLTRKQWLKLYKHLSEVICAQVKH